jgi:hypothetical protein
LKFFNWLRGQHKHNVLTVALNPAQELSNFDLKLYEAANERQEIERRLEQRRPSGIIFADSVGGRMEKEDS